MNASGPVAAVLLLSVLVGCGGTAEVTAQDMKTKIQPTLQRQLRKQLDDKSIMVDRLDCVKKAKSDGMCLAELSDDAGETVAARIVVDIDPDTGRAIWRVTDVSER